MMRLTVILAAAFCLMGCNKATEQPTEKPAPQPTPSAPAASAPQGDMITTASGLKYQVLKKGTGTVSPKATDTVNVHYHGTLLDGTVFDSSVERGQPISFPLNGVIRGWTEGLQLMKVGDKFKFVIPPDLAYGDEESQPEDPTEQHLGLRGGAAGHPIASFARTSGRAYISEQPTRVLNPANPFAVFPDRLERSQVAASRTRSSRPR